MPPKCASTLVRTCSNLVKPRRNYSIKPIWSTFINPHHSARRTFVLVRMVPKDVNVSWTATSPARALFSVVTEDTKRSFGALRKIAIVSFIGVAKCAVNVVSNESRNTFVNEKSKCVFISRDIYFSLSDLCFYIYACTDSKAIEMNGLSLSTWSLMSLSRAQNTTGSLRW